MFGKRKRDSRQQPTLRPSQALGPSGRQAIGVAFQLGVDLYDLATHPTMGWQVMHDPRTSTVTLFRPNSGSIQLGFARAVHGRWIALQDEYGKQLPVELYRDGRSGALFARWIEVSGDSAPGPGPQLSDEERRQAAQAANEQQAQAHASAMGIIYNIR